jgi:hypothetical protein
MLGQQDIISSSETRSYSLSVPFRAHARVEASHACAELFRRTFFEKVWTDIVGTDVNLYFN